MRQAHGHSDGNLDNYSVNRNVERGSWAHEITEKKKSKATGNCTRPSVLHSGKECDYALSVSKNFE